MHSTSGEVERGKVQGMEYDIVVIPMSFTHFIMHNTKLIYTAITRAKHKCILIGEGAAFESACRRVETTKRDTVFSRSTSPEVECIHKAKLH